MSPIQKYIWPMVLIVACMAVISFAFMYLGQEANRAIMEAVNQPTLQKIGTESPAGQPEIKVPSVAVYTYKNKNGRFFKISWENLPNGTTRLNIFRSKTGTSNWSLWKSLNVPTGSLSSGEIELKLASGELTGGYSFYTEAASDNGSSATPLWVSSSTEALPPPPSAPTSTPPGENPPTSNPIEQLLPPAEVAPSSTPVTPPSSTGTSPESTTTIYYYTPQGTVSGSTNVSSSSPFWVQHVNRAIEIGWQNIGTTDKAMVSRSLNSNGPWTEIINQKNPSDSYSIRLVDETLYTGHYYKLDIYSGTNIAESYGPIELPPLQ
jgi:hypothetical protein